MIHRLNRYGPPLAAGAVFIGLCLFVMAGVYSFRQQRHVDHQLCVSAVENRMAVRDTWNAARELILKSQTDQKMKDQTNAFFDGVLRPIPPLRCVDNRPVPKEGS